MKDMRSVGFFVAGFVVAALLAGIYVWRKGPITPYAGGDDEPVVVAGGSFDIGSHNGFEKVDARHANHKHKGRTVNRIDILYNDPTAGPGYQEFDVVGDLKVDIEYLPNDTTKPLDTVTFTADKSGHNLGVANDPKCPAIGDEVSSGSTKIVHRPSEGTVRGITIGGKFSPALNPNPQHFPCANGKCQVVLHYWCQSGGPHDNDCK